MKKLVIIAAVVSALAAPALAQDQATYKIMAIQGRAVLVGQKTYLMLDKCPGFEPGDIITFSEDPITCQTVTAINIEDLKDCQLKCVDNTGKPGPINNPPTGPDEPEDSAD